MRSARFTLHNFLVGLDWGVPGPPWLRPYMQSQMLWLGPSQYFCQVHACVFYIRPLNSVAGVHTDSQQNCRKPEKLQQQTSQNPRPSFDRHFVGITRHNVRSWGAKICFILFIYFILSKYSSIRWFRNISAGSWGYHQGEFQRYHSGKHFRVLPTKWQWRLA